MAVSWKAVASGASGGSRSMRKMPMVYVPADGNVNLVVSSDEVTRLARKTTLSLIHNYIIFINI